MIKGKILVTGVAGQLGYDVMQELIDRNIDCAVSHVVEPNIDIPVHFEKLDITDKNAVIECICRLRPVAVIHCAAWTAVDSAEDEVNHSKVYDINVNGTENLALACRMVDAKMLYISTDYVFNGQGESPWHPDCSDFDPLNYYGMTKLAGEQKVATILEKYFIVRIAWVFGLNGNNFVRTMINIAKSRDSVCVVNDQIGTPTYTVDLARLLIDMISTEKYGYYHATNSGGYISWYDFCCEIYRMMNFDTKVIPISTSDYGVAKAKRPNNSRLDKRKLNESGFASLPSWQDALKRYLDQIKKLY